MSIKSIIQVPLGDDFVECSVSLPATIGSARISQFTSRVSAAVFEIASDIDEGSATPSSSNRSHSRAESNIVSIQLRGADGFTVWFKVKRQATLYRVMETYGRQAGVRITRLNFVFEGQRIHHSYSADTLDMEDGDTIDVYRIRESY
ncbi:Small ubiquitin-related modifier 3 [Fulvia fulva]|uniref:Small ubiquitin-related modifier 3 n=1 Tax=Passalora fulva TaxID=5499 RepID=A0A9Q8LFF9_PASFU|nr:Small ubiquitin-related modifier 3 [Fulvia fulva]KAK4615608.1 Small ubiquitin-related modifier 3 [Fulvia fulva]KAK4616544.1 Small ubiquitin-related modifier 3 [Fulvia fulva]UJO15683.1 Small ubiquitin-related modifier 3 [Fulvia fulva]WPV19485.1 Small ubiquitin-related modifier 3 [Fulvia fulva]WPV34001.1 Small ubiquitin-related modifier 3 [Fulvia fulva]